MHALGSMFSDLLKRHIIVPSMKRENSVRFPMNQGKYPSKREHLLLTRRERLKSALYVKLKQCKVFKIVKGGPLGFLKVQFVAKYQKN